MRAFFTTRGNAETAQAHESTIRPVLAASHNMADEDRNRSQLNALPAAATLTPAPRFSTYFRESSHAANNKTHTPAMHSEHPKFREMHALFMDERYIPAFHYLNRPRLVYCSYAPDPKAIAIPEIGEMIIANTAAGRFAIFIFHRFEFRLEGLNVPSDKQPSLR